MRRKGKEKEMAEPSAAPLSPKKGNEVNTGTNSLVRKETTKILRQSIMIASHANDVGLVSRQAS